MIKSYLRKYYIITLIMQSNSSTKKMVRKPGRTLVVKTNQTLSTDGLTGLVNSSYLLWKQTHKLIILGTSVDLNVVSTIAPTISLIYKYKLSVSTSLIHCDKPSLVIVLIFLTNAVAFFKSDFNWP